MARAAVSPPIPAPTMTTCSSFMLRRRVTARRAIGQQLSRGSEPQLVFEAEKQDEAPDRGELIRRGLVDCRLPGADHVGTDTGEGVVAPDAIAQVRSAWQL